MGKEKVPDKCPHCGAKLSPWQQVLLSVDKAIMCKNCWYRIILDSILKDEIPTKKHSSMESNKKRKEDGNL
jgi:DNA-directed RNA polymerase subunit RPC12/RpoP